MNRDGWLAVLPTFGYFCNFPARIPNGSTSFDTRAKNWFLESLEVAKLQLAQTPCTKEVLRVTATSFATKTKHCPQCYSDLGTRTIPFMKLFTRRLDAAVDKASHIHSWRAATNGTLSRCVYRFGLAGSLPRMNRGRYWSV